MILQMPAASFGGTMNSLKDDCAIKNVWNHNLHEEFHVIRQVWGYLAIGALIVIISINFYL